MKSQWRARNIRSRHSLSGWIPAFFMPAIYRRFHFALDPLRESAQIIRVIAAHRYQCGKFKDARVSKST